MRKIGDITPTANDQGEFTDGDVAQYIQPTLLMAAWFNVVQRELCNVVEFDGTQPDKANDQQVLEAIEKLIDREIKKLSWEIRHRWMWEPRRERWRQVTIRVLLVRYRKGNVFRN